MIDIEHLRTTVASGLRDYLGCPVVRSNQNEEPPPYPYCSYTITQLMSENKGTYGEYEDGTDRKPFTQTWSITVQSGDSSESMTLAVKAHEWLDHIGRIYLNDNGVIIQSVGNISNRDNILTVEYEYRNGFDVVFWLFNEVDSPKESTGYVEGVDLEGSIIEPTTPVEELNERLEDRLEGGD